jgi:hypothetical protein
MRVLTQGAGRAEMPPREHLFHIVCDLLLARDAASRHGWRS